MNKQIVRRPPPVRLRPARVSDLAALLAIEESVFDVDLLSRRSLRHFIESPLASFIVAHSDRDVVGYALVLYRPNSGLARLYSYGVARAFEGQGIGTLLLGAAERAAKRRRCRAMRLEVHDHNTRAIARYEKSGYRLFGRHRDYYDDHGDALRFEKPLVRELRQPAAARGHPDTG